MHHMSMRNASRELSQARFFLVVPALYLCSYESSQLPFGPRPVATKPVRYKLYHHCDVDICYTLQPP